MDVIAESMMGYMKFNLISIGMKNNIFENMAQPISCKELAEKCGCDERYLKEWCQALTLGKILKMTSEGKFFVETSLLESIRMQKTGYELSRCLGEKLETVSNSFKTGEVEAISYDAYTNVQTIIERLMADFYRVHFGKLLKNNVTFKGIPEALSKERSRVMDFGCGCGKSTIAIAEAFPKSTVIGYDLDKLSIDRAKENGKNFENVFFECDDVCNFHPQGVPQAERFDLVTFLLCLHDLSYPTKSLKIARDVLKPDGSVVILEVMAADEFSPENTDEFQSIAISVMHCLPCSRPSSGPPGEDIGNPFRFGQLEKIAKEAGFETVEKAEDPVLFDTRINLFRLRK